MRTGGKVIHLLQDVSMNFRVDGSIPLDIQRRHLCRKEDFKLGIRPLDEFPLLGKYQGIGLRLPVVGQADTPKSLFRGCLNHLVQTDRSTRWRLGRMNVEIYLMKVEILNEVHKALLSFKVKGLSPNYSALKLQRSRIFTRPLGNSISNAT